MFAWMRHATHVVQSDFCCRLMPLAAILDEYRRAIAAAQRYEELKLHRESVTGRHDISRRIFEEFYSQMDGVSAPRGRIAAAGPSSAWTSAVGVTLKRLSAKLSCQMPPPQFAVCLNPVDSASNRSNSTSQPADYQITVRRNRSALLLFGFPRYSHRHHIVGSSLQRPLMRSTKI